MKLLGNKRPGIRTGCIVERSEPSFFQYSAAIYSQQDDLEAQFQKSHAENREDVQFDARERRYRRSDRDGYGDSRIVAVYFHIKPWKPGSSIFLQATNVAQRHLRSSTTVSPRQPCAFIIHPAVTRQCCCMLSEYLCAQQLPGVGAMIGHNKTRSFRCIATPLGYVALTTLVEDACLPQCSNAGKTFRSSSNSSALRS